MTLSHKGTQSVYYKLYTLCETLSLSACGRIVLFGGVSKLSLLRKGYKMKIASRVGREG
jgi:hypothetical protein